MYWQLVIKFKLKDAVTPNPAFCKKVTAYPRMALPHRICAAQTTQF
jgi:hypothetical protein